MSHRDDVIEQLVSTDISRPFAERMLDLAIGEAAEEERALKKAADAEVNKLYQERVLPAEKRIEELEAQLKIEKEMNAALRDVMKDEERASRQAFIRQAAIAFYAQDSTWAAETYWIRAQALWAAKPEDC